MTQKVTGYLLLLAGILVIAYALYSVYTVFTNQAEPVQLFDFPGISLDLNQGASIELPQELQEAGVQVNQNQTPKQELLSPDVLNQTSNIIAHLVFMGFIVNVGYKIALLGVEMNREVHVKVSKNALQEANKSVLLPNKPVNK